MSIIAELKRRKVVQVAAVYAVVAWLSIQIITAIEEPLALPEWMDTFVIVLLAIGFPIALILSWAFDVTPDGIKTAGEVSKASSSGQPPANTVTNVIQGLVLLAVGFLLIDQYFLDDTTPDRDSITRADDNPLLVTRFEYLFDGEEAFAGQQLRLAISPDGRHFAHIISGEIYVRAMNELRPRQINGIDDADTLIFSPNGQSIVYWSRGSQQLIRVAINGGAPTLIASGIEHLYGMSWAKDGSIIYADNDGISQVREDGSASAEQIISIRDEMQPYGPQLLPDGDSVLFSVAYPGDWDGGEIVVESISTHERKVIVAGGTAVRYLASGHMTYALSDQLFAVAFDLESMTVNGAANPVADGVVRASNVWETGAAHYDVSATGTLVYMTANQDRSLIPTWVDRMGGESVIGMDPGDYSAPKISPEGSHALFDMRGPGNPMVVWSFDDQRITRLNLGPNGGDSPIWSPNGENVTYHPGRGTFIDEVSMKNVGSPRRIVIGGSGALDPFHPDAYSPGGDSIIIHGISSLTTSWDIGMISLEETGETQWLLQGPSWEGNATISPDGRWLAYQSNESGRHEIYVRPFPNVDDDLEQVSNRGGTAPVWSENSNELFFLEPDNTLHMVAVDVDTTGETISLGNQKTLFDWTYSTSFDKGYDVTADGQRFLALKPTTSETTTPKIIVVNNWFEELRQLAPTE